MEHARAVGLASQIVAIQPIGERARRRGQQRRAGAEHPTLHQIDVEIAVVVVVEERDAWRHDFRLVELAAHAVEVDEVDRRFRVRAQ